MKLRIVTNEESLAEPTDEEMWLSEIAQRVEADARPLFAAVWLELLRRALEADDQEPAS